MSVTLGVLEAIAWDHDKMELPEHFTSSFEKLVNVL